MDSVVYFLIAFQFGAGFVFLACLNHILTAHSISYQFVSSELEKAKESLEDKCIEFDAITKKASDANASLASRIPDIDNKIADMQNRIQMMGLKISGR
jgi:hypothetical protein